MVKGLADEAQILREKERRILLEDGAGFASVRGAFEFYEYS